jgi:hypothetical protein
MGQKLWRIRRVSHALADQKAVHRKHAGTVPLPGGHYGRIPALIAEAARLLNRDVLALDVADFTEARATSQNYVYGSSDPRLTNPTTGVAACCARPVVALRHAGHEDYAPLHNIVSTAALHHVSMPHV